MSNLDSSLPGNLPTFTGPGGQTWTPLRPSPGPQQPHRTDGDDDGRTRPEPGALGGPGCALGAAEASRMVRSSMSLRSHTPAWDWGVPFMSGPQGQGARPRAQRPQDPRQDASPHQPHVVTSRSLWAGALGGGNGLQKVRHGREGP